MIPFQSYEHRPLAIATDRNGVRVALFDLYQVDHFRSFEIWTVVMCR